MNLRVFFSFFFAFALQIQASAAKTTSEYDLLRRFPTNTLTALVAGGEPNAQGFVGFHKRNGAWYEAGMQRGGCWYLIGAVVASDEKRAEAGWKSIEATFARQIEDGGFLSNQRPGITHPPTFDERVETAFFYLQELAHALLIIRDSPLRDHFQERISTLEPRIQRACAFIRSGYGGIVKKSGHTANRLFIAAKAFGLCGALLKDEELKALSRELVAAAMQRRDADGVFIEKGGKDTSYNAVSLLMAQVLALYIPNPQLDAALVRAMAWQRTHIRPTGEVEVSGNTRTGVGQEIFMGRAKEVNYREVALALCYFGMIHDDADALALAEKVRTWRDKAAR